MAIPQLLIFNTLNRFFRFSSVKNAQETEEETEEKKKKPENITERLRKTNDIYVRELVDFLQKKVMEDLDEESEKEFRDIVRKFPSIVDRNIEYKIKGASPDKKEVIKDGFLTDLLTALPKYIHSFDRSLESKETLGKRFRSAEKAIARIRIYKGSQDFLEKLIRAGRFKAKIKGRFSDLKGVYTAEGSFEVPTDKNLEKELNDGGIVLEILDGRTEFTPYGSEHSVWINVTPLQVGKVFTFKHEGHGKVKKETRNQGYFLVEEKAKSLIDHEKKYGTLSVGELEGFLDWSVRHYISTNPHLVNEVLETDMEPLEGELFEGDKRTNKSLEEALQDLGKLEEYQEAEKIPPKGFTPKEKREEVEKEEKEKKGVRDRTRRRLGLSEDAWEHFAPSEKDKLDNEIDRIINTISNQYDPVNDITTDKGLMFNKIFIKKFLTDLFLPSTEKLTVDDWYSLVRDNVNDWVLDNEKLREKYEDIATRKSGALSAEKFLQEVSSNKKIKPLFDRVLEKLNEKQTEESEKKREELAEENKKIEKQNLYRTQQGLKPIPKKEVPKKIKKIHPWVEEIKKGLSGEKGIVGVKTLRKIISADPELHDEVYADTDLYEKLYPKVGRDVFGEKRYPYVKELVDDVLKKIEAGGDSKFPNFMKALRWHKGWEKIKERKKENRKKEKGVKEYGEEVRKELKKQFEKAKFKKEAHFLSVYSFAVRCAYLKLKSKA